MFNIFNKLSLFASVTNSDINSVDSSISDDTSSLSNIDWNQVLNTIYDWIIHQGIKILIGLIVLFIGFKIINKFSNNVKKKMIERNREKTLISVTYQVLKYGLKIGLLFLVITFVGFDTAGIGAIISSLGVGISLAVQGSLSNFAGGLVILVMKPFKIGDYITAQGCSGTVEEIKMFYTYVVTPDNKVQMIPNGVLANDVIVNVSAKDTRRVDFLFSIAYGEDSNKTKEIIYDMISTNDKVLSDPKPFVTVSSYANSAIDITVRVWVNRSDYWNVYFDLNEKINTAIMDAGIEIPYDKLDVNITKEK